MPRRTFVSRHALLLAAAALGTVMATPGTATARRDSRDYRMVWDDFADGFRAEGEDARWFHVAGGPYRADDGVVTTRKGELSVRARGSHPVTGEPAFTQTIPADNPIGMPGSGDHAKFIAYTSHTATSGHPGFDAEDGYELLFETRLSGRTYGTAGHPFGDAVSDPDDDLRLASAMMLTTDPETSVSFDFVVTNKRIYAWYGRPTFMRGELGDYASFAHTVPLADRAPDDTHRFGIAYDRAAGVVRWLIDGREVFRVDRIGFRLDRSTATLDEGGEETLIKPRQLNAGLGLLTLLDASWPTDKGLVRLSSRTHSTYYRPSVGAPAELEFADEESTEAGRLFGQGASFRLGPYRVSSRRVR
ncbi:DUF6081 family protein [Streptomyces fulvorobeus]|uniref:Uncharacterized protein n=1 Tax=Streptomyces fulvorobeus TaxID=284028 RepID=A0A7J0CD15_9ACTN|nr:DUF6081 family protein [Streptomyces fulvorobeus]NYE43812.1 hypothetical protein [Streptomyces fulvorobeus]GFN00299.1 hypothetical protein Sfulv_51090 [Streptomyces fulvorobeus]